VTIDVGTSIAPDDEYADASARDQDMNAIDTMTLTTPGLLFPAISLLLLAYTNRFHTLATIIRQLHPGEGNSLNDLARQQLGTLRSRVTLIRHMQSCAVLSFLLCALSMFALFVGTQTTGKVLFGLSLASLAASLVMSFIEVLQSTRALKVVIDDMARR
jgi:hypothetical protein